MSSTDPLAFDEFPDPPATRPAWLVTLADLGLLLVGFFVLLQANQTVDRQALARALRGSFGGTILPEGPEPMPVATASIDGFAPGSSTLPRNPQDVIGWARDMSRDARTVLTVIGSVDGTNADVDPQTGSGAVLAVDRARAVATVLAGAIPGVRLAIAAAPDTDGPHRRKVQVSLGFAGERQDSATRQDNAAAGQDR